MNAIRKFMGKIMGNRKKSSIRKTEDFRDDLIDFYRTRHSVVPRSSTLEGPEMPLKKWYITPTMKEKQFQGEIKDQLSERVVDSLSGLFFEGENECKSVYLTSSKGSGKTTFAKYMTLVWCQSKSPEPDIGVSEKDLCFVKSFDFVFFVSLKDSVIQECMIDHMIYSQIIRHLQRSYSHDFLKQCLRTHRCLIILDGLDEWRANPKCTTCGNNGMPHAKTWKKCTYLTTSTTEKLESLNLKKEQVAKWVALKERVLEGKYTAHPSDIEEFTQKERRDPVASMQYKIAATEIRNRALENETKHLNVRQAKAFQERLIAHYRENAPKIGKEDTLKHMKRKFNFKVLPKIEPACKLDSAGQYDRNQNDRKLPKGVSSFVESMCLDPDESKRLIVVTGQQKEIDDAYVDILNTWIDLVENGEDSDCEEYDTVLLLKGSQEAEYPTDFNAFVCHHIARIFGCSSEEIKYELSRCRKCLVLLDDTVKIDVSTLQVKSPYFVIYATTGEPEKSSMCYSLNRNRNVIITLKKNNYLTATDGYEICRWIENRLGYGDFSRCNHRLCFVNMKAETKTYMNVTTQIDVIEIHNCDKHIFIVHGARNLQLHGISILDFGRFTANLRQLEHLSLYFEDCPGQKRCRTLSEKIIEDITSSVDKCLQLRVVELNNISIGRYTDITHSIKRSTIEQIKQDVSIRSPSIICSALLGPCLENLDFDKTDFDLEDSKFAKGIIMQILCHKLVTSNEIILEAYASENEKEQNERHEISIVCFTKAEGSYLPLSKSYGGFPVLQKQHNSVSTESIIAEADTNDLKYDFKIYQEALFGVIGYNIENLFLEHSNLEAVCGSLVRSTRSGIEKTAPCIVLYCRWKGMIPYGEKEFPKVLADRKGKNNFATDVREGFFVFGPNGTTLTGGATEWNQELAMGCSIGPIKDKYSATIGPFLNVCGDDRTCFLTVRHMFQPFSEDDLSLRGKKIVQPANGDELVNTHGTRNSKQAEERICGEVLVAHFDTQVDAAVVEIYQNRMPKRGNFVSITKDALQFAGFSQSQFPAFDDGKMMDATILTIANHATERIIKFGKQSGLTRGSLDLQNTAVKIKDESELSINHNGQMKAQVMKQQLNIKSYSGDPFFLRGDSGSAVFLVDKDNKLHCIAMAIGLLTDLSCVATPIKTILETLNRNSPNGLQFELKKFDFEQMHTEMSN